MAVTANKTQAAAAAYEDITATAEQQKKQFEPINAETKV
jgi:hypothetical protein